MSFIEVQFPVDISYGSKGGPEYSTDIVMTSGGHEQRNSNWASPRLRYNVSYGVKTETQLSTLLAFFRARKGRSIGFRFKDWSDYKAIGQILGTGNGTVTTFQLIKNYTSGSITETRTIKKPVAGTINIYVNSVLQTSGVTTSTTTGVVTFTTPPVNGAIISADFEFDVPVRFDNDMLSASLDTYGIHSVQDITLIEVRV